MSATESWRTHPTCDDNDHDNHDNDDDYNDDHLDSEALVPAPREREAPGHGRGVPRQRQV